MSHGAHGSGGGFALMVVLYVLVRLIVGAVGWVHKRWEQ